MKARDAAGRPSGEAVDELQRGEYLRATPAGAGFAGVVAKVLGIASVQSLQGERRVGAVAQ